MKIKKFITAVLGAVLGALGTAALATPVGPTYSAPIVFSWSGTGISPGHVGGLNWDFTGVNTANFAELYWGVGNIGAAMDGAIDSAGETMSYSGTSGYSAFWTGTTQVQTVTGLLGVLTRFTATINTGVTGWTGAAGVGITEPGYPVVTQMTGPLLNVDFLFEASVDGGTTWYAQNQLYDNLQTTGGNGGSRTSFDSGFYYVAPVPLPAAFPLLLAAIGGLGFVSRFRRRQA